ncbi:MAG: fimbrial protein [Dysgonomonas sp.]
MKKIVYIVLCFNLLFVACSSEDTLDLSSGNNKIELTFEVDNYIKSTKATTPGSTEEQTIENLYLFLFPTTGSQSLKKYYISASTFSNGSWNNSDKKILLNTTQAEAGNRIVCIVANCSEIKTSLDNITSFDDLKTILYPTNNPWSTNITTPLLMTGNKTHDFNTNYQLNNVVLIRAVAKVQLNIKLSPEHQSIPIIASKSQYNYKYIDFDKNTYVLKPSAKTDNLVSSANWVAWTATGAVTSYVLDQNKVTSLSLTTYLNERDNAGSAIEISLPYQATGPLPPPEFGDETYKLLLPAKIERNHWYVYDVEI